MISFVKQPNLLLLSCLYIGYLLFPCESFVVSKLSLTTRRNLHFDDNHHRKTTKLQVVELASIVQAIDTLWKASPYAAAAVTCGFKASAADFVAQKRQHRKGVMNNVVTAKKEQLEDVAPNDNHSNPLQRVKKRIQQASMASSSSSSNSVDFKRNVAYLTYGAIYQGASQEFIYNHIYPAMFGSGTDVKVVLAKVAFDLLIQTTLVTLPIAYVTKALIFQYSFVEAFRRYVDDILHHGLLLKYFAIWGPVQCITFSIIPEHWRVTFIAFVSFFWLIILSSIASRVQQQQQTTTIPSSPE